MSNRASANRLVNKRYEQGKRIVAHEEGRRLTQREFLDVGFGLNPRTSKPYNTRTLRKWLSGERSAAQAVEFSKEKTYTINQRVRVGDRFESTNLVKPSNRSGLDLFTGEGRKRVKRATKTSLTQRIQQDSPGRLQEFLRTLRTLRMGTARAPLATRRPSVIITRTTRSPLGYVSQ